MTDKVGLKDSLHKVVIEGRYYGDKTFPSLNNYLADSLQQQKRISMVFFSLKKKKAEKQYMKLMKKYKKGYEVRYLNASDFKFKAVDMSPDNQ